MAFRDDRDALLARNDALERQIAELETERDRAVGEARKLRAELKQIRGRLAKLEAAKRRRGGGEPDPGWDWLRSRRVASFAGPVVIAVGLATVLLFAVCKGNDGASPRAVDEPAEPVAEAAATDQPQPPSALAIARAVRMCLDRADLLARIALVRALGDARVSGDRDDLPEALEKCDGWLARLGENGLAALPELEALTRRYRETMAALGDAWHLHVRLIVSGDAAAPGGAEKLSAAKQAMREAGARFLPVSRALRLATESQRAEAIASRRGALERATPGERATFEVAVRAGELLDAFALGSAADVQAALDAYLQAREDPEYRETDRAMTFTRFIREAAAATIAARLAQAPEARDAGLVAEAEHPDPVLPPEATHELGLALSYFEMAGFAYPL